MHRFIFAVYIGLLSAPAIGAEIHKIPYVGFTIWIDCDQRGAIRFEYIASKDIGTEPRVHSFYKDDEVDSRCQQISTKAYGSQYDRRHLVPANHLDHSEKAIKQSNDECVATSQEHESRCLAADRRNY